jgi:hypothetical protein
MKRPQILRWYFPRSEQEAWDTQIEMQREDPAGIGRAAQQIATKMQRCRHNPRNEGRGFDNGRWFVDED